MSSSEVGEDGVYARGASANHAFIDAFAQECRWWFPAMAPVFGQVDKQAILHCQFEDLRGIRIDIGVCTNVERGRSELLGPGSDEAEERLIFERSSPPDDAPEYP